MQKSNSLDKKHMPAKAKKTSAARVVKSRIRAIGNSRGVILSTEMIDHAGISPNADIIIRAFKGMISIVESKKVSRVNTNLKTWDKQFKQAIRTGGKPEGDLWEGMANAFDEEGWT
jgi:hypothetical protein